MIIDLNEAEREWILDFIGSEMRDYALTEDYRSLLQGLREKLKSEEREEKEGEK